VCPNNVLGCKHDYAETIKINSKNTEKLAEYTDLMSSLSIPE
jgi:hypothetical protein